MDVRPKTIICDIDGTLFEHCSPDLSTRYDTNVILLPGVIEALRLWDSKGYYIILTTGRRESSRAVTERQLNDAGVFYDTLIMGIGGGPRYLINDRKPDGTDTAFAINLDRNVGMEDINI